jgi:hypothetical protein
MEFEGMMKSRRSFLGLSAIGALGAVTAGLPFAVQAAADKTRDLKVYKTPWCGCCVAWVDHMRAAGFTVTVEERDDLEPLKAYYGVTADLGSCHTGLIDGYVIEGHVPAAEVKRLLEERPEARGLAVPGMPIGSPGMEQGDRKDPYEVILFSDEARSVFARY